MTTTAPAIGASPFVCVPCPKGTWVSAKATALLVAICSYAQVRGGRRNKCFASMANLRRRSGLGHRRMRAAIDELVQAKLVKAHGQRAYTNVFTVIDKGHERRSISFELLERVTASSLTATERAWLWTSALIGEMDTPLSVMAELLGTARGTITRARSRVRSWLRRSELVDLVLRKRPPTSTVKQPVAQQSLTSTGVEDEPLKLHEINTWLSKFYAPYVSELLRVAVGSRFEDVLKLADANARAVLVYHPAHQRFGKAKPAQQGLGCSKQAQALASQLANALRSYGTHAEQLKVLEDAMLVHMGKQWANWRRMGSLTFTSREGRTVWWIQALRPASFVNAALKALGHGRPVVDFYYLGQEQEQAEALAKEVADNPVRSVIDGSPIDASLWRIDVHMGLFLGELMGVGSELRAVVDNHEFRVTYRDASEPERHAMRRSASERIAELLAQHMRREGRTLPSLEDVRAWATSTDRTEWPAASRVMQASVEHAEKWTD